MPSSSEFKVKVRFWDHGAPQLVRYERLRANSRMRTVSRGSLPGPDFGQSRESSQYDAMYPALIISISQRNPMRNTLDQTKPCSTLFSFFRALRDGTSWPSRESGIA